MLRRTNFNRRGQGIAALFFALADRRGPIAAKRFVIAQKRFAVARIRFGIATGRKRIALVGIRNAMKDSANATIGGVFVLVFVSVAYLGRVNSRPLIC